MGGIKGQSALPSIERILAGLSIRRGAHRVDIYTNKNMGLTYQRSLSTCEVEGLLESGQRI